MFREAFVSAMPPPVISREVAVTTTSMSLSLLGNGVRVSTVVSAPAAGATVQMVNPPGVLGATGVAPEIDPMAICGAMVSDRDSDPSGSVSAWVTVRRTD